MPRHESAVPIRSLAGGEKTTDTTARTRSLSARRGLHPYLARLWRRGRECSGDLFESYDLASLTGAIGGVVGALILQAMIPTLSGLDLFPLVSQVIAATASDAVLTVIAGAVKAR